MRTSTEIQEDIDDVRAAIKRTLVSVDQEDGAGRSVSRSRLAELRALLADYQTELSKVTAASATGSTLRVRQAVVRLPR